MNKENKPEFWRNSSYRLAGVIVLTTVLLFAISIAGTFNIKNQVKISVEESMEQSLYDKSQAILQQFEEESIQASIEESIAEETAVHEIELSGDERQLLDLLKGNLEAGQLTEAAALLNDREDDFNMMFFQKLADRLCIYDGYTMVDEVSGYGLVFTRATTVFYGDFKDGKPEGNCLALQAIELEEGRRYDYATGIWGNGKMNGSGECGYNYYEGVTDESTRITSKKGEFADDIMEGTVIYTSSNAEDEAASWTFDVADGVIVQDDRWIQDIAEDSGVVYRLMADNDESHAYTVSESAMKEARWKNLIEY